MNDLGFPMTDGPAPELPSPGAAVRNRLVYGGARGDLAKIAITNAILTLATLGIYRFWGKTRVRRYLWGRISFLGDQAEYTGTGKELLLGFLVALVALALLIGSAFGIQTASGDDHPIYWIAESVYLLILLFLAYVAEYRARRYRLSRTEWRGIRFAQDGSTLRYALLALGWGIVVVLSLGTAYAVYRTRLQHYRTTHTSFGNRRFGLEARAAELVKPWLLAWLFFVPTLGLTYVWYRVREFRYFAEKSRCGAFSFKSDLRAGSVILAVVVYVMSTSITVVFLLLGIATMAAVVLFPALTAAMESAANVLPGEMGPVEMVGYVVAFAIIFPVIGVLRMLFLVHPLFREISGSTSVIGEEDYEAIAQSQQSAPRRGEGLADALDVGAI